MKLLFIDPGTKQSAYVLCEPDFSDMTFDTVENSEMIGFIFHQRPELVVIEKIESYGMAVGEETFETVFWSGKFANEAESGLMDVARIGRKAVKMHLCQNTRAKDANVNQVLRDKFGGDKECKGVKKAPGPLYGIKGDEWAALAVCVTWLEQHAGEYV